VPRRMAQFCQQGEAGEIEMRGMACTLGYWNKPDANAAIFTEDGWMKTGDIGYVDDDGLSTHYRKD
jgi:long-chain acyl-CoA synthetase